MTLRSLTHSAAFCISARMRFTSVPGFTTEHEDDTYAVTREVFLDSSIIASERKQIIKARLKKKARFKGVVGSIMLIVAMKLVSSLIAKWIEGKFSTSSPPPATHSRGRM